MVVQPVCGPADAGQPVTAGQLCSRPCMVAAVQQAYFLVVVTLLAIDKADLCCAVLCFAGRVRPGPIEQLGTTTHSTRVGSGAKGGYPAAAGAPAGKHVWLPGPPLTLFACPIPPYLSRPPQISFASPSDLLSCNMCCPTSFLWAELWLM